MATLQEVKAVQPDWFSRKNILFFSDVSYRVLHSKKTGKPYLARSTYAWSNMTGKNRTLHWRLNSLDEDLKIRPLVDVVFPDLWAVKRWLKEN